MERIKKINTGARAGSSVPARFGCRFSGGIPFGSRGPALGLRSGLRRRLVLWAGRAYMGAVCRGRAGFRRAVALRVLVLFGCPGFARRFGWWCYQVTEPVGE